MNMRQTEFKAATGGPVISLRGVRKQFGSHCVVEDLSFSVARGEIVTLLGRTGAGKTTVLNIIMGTMRADAGAVEVAGADPFKEFKALKGKLAVAFQTDRLLPWRTAVENAELGLLIAGEDRRTARAGAIKALAAVNLSGAETKYPHELSGGMRQRVSLARALAVDPELILLDESFSQLDHVTSRTLRQDFCKVAREFHKTCLIVTHRIDDALEMADRVIVLGPGARIVLEMPLAAARIDEKTRDQCRAQIETALGGKDEDDEG
ncbi:MULTISPECIES: ABC transporter ATP-binding protein [Bradyrhizobium]|nr:MULTISPECIES: ATP-binding cassette domain-containing protein [Bradyrhizobium]